MGQYSMYQSGLGPQGHSDGRWEVKHGGPPGLVDHRFTIYIKIYIYTHTYKAQPREICVSPGCTAAMAAAWPGSVLLPHKPP